MGSQKTIVAIVFLLSSLCSWILYSTCLIVVTAQIAKDYHEDENQVMELKGFLGLVMVPQYICAMLYVLAVAAFVVDVLSKEKRRIHFLTTSFTNGTAMFLLVSAGFALFANIAMIIYITLVERQEDTEGSGSISMIANASLLPRVNKEIAFIASWAKTLLFSLSVMLGLYGLYMCYWPHSLRYRRRIDKRLLSNIESVDDDDL